MKSKEKYDNILNDKIIHCDFCDRNYTKIKFRRKGMKESGESGKCLYCDWIHRHDNIIPLIEGWNEEEVKTAIHFILMDDSPYLNDLLKLYKGKSLKDVCLLVQNLHVGNKHTLVLSQCEYCGKQVENPPSVYLKNQYIYCSLNCYWNDKTDKMPKGKDSQFYNRVETKCSNCHKSIFVIPYSYNIENKYGESHNFCSQECYWEFRSKYYIGEKGAAYQRELTEEQREKMRLTVLRNSRSGDRFNSKIQLDIDALLDKNKISFEREKIIKYYAVDNFLADSGLIIEVMGDYWHSNPNRYNDNKYMLNEMQAKGIIKDKQKHSYILNHNQIEILYLWEYDIEHNLELCEKLILEYIKTNGKLKNYHSFNYYMDNNLLKLKEQIIVPYQDMSIDEYRHLIKQKKIS